MTTTAEAGAFVNAAEPALKHFFDVLPPAVGLTVSPVVFGQFRGSRDPVSSL
jgi:hypothetical protein